MLKIARLNDDFSEFLNWEQAQEKLNHCCKKIRKGEKGKDENKIFKRTKSVKTRALSRNFDLFSFPRKNVVKRGASAKKDMPSF